MSIHTRIALCGRRRSGAHALLCAFVCAVSLSSCAHRRAGGEIANDLYERSGQALTEPAAAAATCIIKNASQAGYTASEQPLYGMTAVAVNVRPWSVGDVVASVTLLPRLTGSNATVTTTRNGPVRDRPKLVEQLLSGC